MRSARSASTRRHASAFWCHFWTRYRRCRSCSRAPWPSRAPWRRARTSTWFSPAALRCKQVRKSICLCRRCTWKNKNKIHYYFNFSKDFFYEAATRIWLLVFFLLWEIWWVDSTWIWCALQCFRPPARVDLQCLLVRSAFWQNISCRWCCCCFNLLTRKSLKKL